MSTTSDSRDSAPTPPSSVFQQLLGEYLRLAEGAESTELSAWRAAHPDFVARFGRQIDALVSRLAARRDDLSDRIGPYRVLQLLDEGGMGAVYLAEQTAPFQRLVALKIVKPGKETDSRLRRFADEIQALALLNHDGIARLFEAGSDRGRPWFAMEFVPGVPITAYCDEQGLDLRARLLLMVRVCRAVEHAHRQGILHRDLKPANILAFGPSDEPFVKVIDFGLAKVLQADAPQRTATRQFVGTPDYMSPEQVDAERAAAVDTRTDVYALGVVLYQLLTGVLPLALCEQRGIDAQGLIRQIRERQPSSPSVRVAESESYGPTSRAIAGGGSPRRLRRILAGDLDGIVMKAMAKDVDARYGGVGELADDLLRYLRDEPVAARRPTQRYVAWKFVRRHRFAVAAAATLLLLLSSAGWVYLVMQHESLRRLERGNLFGLASHLEALLAADARDPPPARPEQLAALQCWLAEAQGVVAHLERLRAVASAQVAETAAPAGPDDWASGGFAQRALRDAALEAVDRIAAIERPGAHLDKMRQRIDWAQRVARETIELHWSAWMRVRAEVRAEPAYRGLELEPQVGLVPLGRDGSTGLQWFALPLPGAELPQRRGDRFVVGPASCPLFVLLPGDPAARHGSQRDAADGLRYDPDREPFEDDLVARAVAPFFASVCEFTLGQWRLLDPFQLAPDYDGLAAAHPAHDVPGWAIEHVVRAWGMRLPTPWEWEYLARSGSDAPYWFGDSWRGLEGRANVFDQALVAVGRGEEEVVPWDDGYAATAPVGSFMPNGFLLHDVAGNVFEAVATGGREDRFWDLRGGSWHTGARSARLTARVAWDGSPRPSIGFRPVVSVH